MNILIKTSMLTLFGFALSCNSTKAIVNENKASAANTKAMETIDYTQEGYKMGTVQLNKDSACKYTILVDKSNIRFDPVNMDDKRFEAFKSDAQKVYFKFRPLRMMNRCPEAQPIEIEDIKKEKVNPSLFLLNLCR